MALIKIMPFIIIFILIIYEDQISTPSCKLVPGANSPEKIAGENGQNSGEDDLKVMIVANLLLLGSEAGSFNFFFRDYYLSKFFKKSFQLLKPDMLLVLGDVSARGAELTRSNWSSVIQQFHKMLGPFLDLPYHVLLGDRDIGGCSDLNSRSVSWISSNFPGLDSSGCSAFGISNTSFVSLNSVALLCGDNSLRFGVERTVEIESTELQMETEKTEQLLQVPKDITFKDFSWRENVLSSGSGPVLLLHMPLHLRPNYRQESNMYDEYPESMHWDATSTESRGLSGVGPYELWHTLPPNATEYIFQALKPRIIFSAHTHKFCDRTHYDGTREITVPAMSWEAIDDPGFVVASFKSDRKSVSVSHCLLAKESSVIFTCTSILVLTILSLFVTHSPSQTNSLS
ncbi:uncharacterized protein LOC141721661 isoform X1 [Apium graveolens]|uniref:uncharacterized protein LOC141721661 isoform X1 n=1 Tax=Apium graveolens TaxID=4045 RepID=UPI003D79E064